MKFPPKECPACGCPYWSKNLDTTGDPTTIWKGADGEWYHGPAKSTSMMVCPNCRFGFSHVLEQGKLASHTFLENLVKSYQKYIHPGVANRMLLNLPPTISFLEAKTDRKEGHIDLTFRLILQEHSLPEQPEKAPAEQSEE